MSAATPTHADIQFICRGDQGDAVDISLVLYDEGGSTISELMWANLDENVLAEIAAQTGRSVRDVDYALSAAHWAGDTDNGEAMMVTTLWFS